MASLIDKYSSGSLFDDIEERQIIWHIMLDAERKKYAQLFEDYKVFLKACRELVEELSIDESSLSKIKCIDKLLSLGKFSYGSNFSYDSFPQELFGIHGVFVVLGRGCCRHLTSFATDVLSQGNDFCDKFYCKATQFPMTETLDGSADHTINIIKYNDGYIGYDITNHEECYFISPMQLKTVKSLMYMHYRPELQMAFEGMNREHLERNLLDYSQSVGTFDLTDEKLSDMSCEVSAKIISKLKVVQDFEKSTEEIKEKIYRQIPR